MHRITAFAFFSLCASPGMAGQINWSGAFGAVNLKSTGVAMDGQMVMELGVFVTGFTPSAGNTSLWATNWRRASIVLYNPETRLFTGSHSVTSNASPFLAGTKGYIWGHDGNHTDSEWILMSAPTWTWPSQSPLELPVNWTVSTASQVTVGQTNGAGFAMKSAKATGPLPITTWDEWRAKAFNTTQLADPAVSGPNADPDKDGMVNLIEFALGGHPLIAGASERIVPGLIFSGGRYRLTMKVLKRCDRAASFSAQASLNLATWPAGGTIELQNTTALFEAVENVTSPTDSRAFLRAVIQAP